MRKMRSVFLSALVLYAGAALAHHSPIVFDRTHQITIEGVVTEFKWSSPHSWIHLDVKGPDGTVTNWMVEAGPPNALLRRGWTRKSLLPGTVLLVEGYQAKDGSNHANGRDITLPDGRKLFVGSSGTGAPDERPEK